MARGLSFRVEFAGLDEFIEQMDGWEEEFSRNLNEGMDEYGMLLEEGSRSLAPYDDGGLETSIEFKPLRHVGKTVEGEVGTDKEYALKRHEAPYKPGVHDKYDGGVKFEDYYLNGRGRRTYRKGKWRGLPAGRKYIERAVVSTEPDFEDIMIEVQENTLRGMGR